MEFYYRLLFGFCMLVLVCLIPLYLVRSVIGPQFADRILAINAISTLSISAIAILAVRMGESYLLDVCMIYAMLSFLAMVVLFQMISRTHLEEELGEEDEEDAGMD